METTKASSHPSSDHTSETAMKIRPVVLSKLIYGYERVSPKDHRVIAVGRVLGLLPDECFEEANEEQRS